jgi:hypothetical protein
MKDAAPTKPTTEPPTPTTPPPQTPQLPNCTFDDDTTSGWEIHGLQFKWSIQSLGNLTCCGHDAPINEHDTYFLYVEVRPGSQLLYTALLHPPAQGKEGLAGETTSLQSPYVENAESACLEFWYSLYVSPALAPDPHPTLSPA